MEALKRMFTEQGWRFASRVLELAFRNSAKF